MSWKETNEYQRKTFKGDAIRIAGALAKAKIDYSLEWVIPRYGEFKNGHPLSYVVDILVMDERYEPVAIEVEGEGSASRDNLKRDGYLSTLGIRVLHVDNKTKGDEVIARLNGSFRKP
jgi:hypothetical protein